VEAAMVDGKSAVRVDRSADGKVWRTKDGRRIPIPIREMTDEHLADVMQFLRRAHRRYVDTVTFYGVPDTDNIGEFAREAVEQEMLDAFESKVDDLYPIYDDLMTEAIRRGLVK
jgi:hypothetical protein